MKSFKTMKCIYGLLGFREGKSKSYQIFAKASEKCCHRYDFFFSENGYKFSMEYLLLISMIITNEKIKMLCLPWDTDNQNLIDYTFFMRVTCVVHIHQNNYSKPPKQNFIFNLFMNISKDL